MAWLVLIVHAVVPLANIVAVGVVQTRAAHVLRSKQLVLHNRITVLVHHEPHESGVAKAVRDEGNDGEGKKRHLDAARFPTRFENDLCTPSKALWKQRE